MQYFNLHSSYSVTSFRQVYFELKVSNGAISNYKSESQISSRLYVTIDRTASSICGTRAWVSERGLGVTVYIEYSEVWIAEAVRNFSLQRELTVFVKVPHSSCVESLTLALSHATDQGSILLILMWHSGDYSQSVAVRGVVSVKREWVMGGASWPEWPLALGASASKTEINRNLLA